MPSIIMDESMKTLWAVWNNESVRIQALLRLRSFQVVLMISGDGNLSVHFTAVKSDFSENENQGACNSVIAPEAMDGKAGNLLVGTMPYACG